ICKTSGRNQMGGACSVHRHSDQGYRVRYVRTSAVLQDRGVPCSRLDSDGGCVGLPKSISSQGAVRIKKINAALLVIGLLALTTASFSHDAIGSWPAS